MASIGDLKGRVVITNSGSAVLRTIKTDIDAIAAASRKLDMGQFGRNLAASTQAHVQRLNRLAAPSAAAATAAGLGVRSMIDATRQFNESKFGYGFARMTDYIKGGKLDMASWRADMNATAKAVQAKAKDFGAIPEVVMQAREEVEKLGFKGDTSNAVWESALGLHLSEPSKLASGQAAQYLGAVYRAFDGERRKMAAKLGKDADDPEFNKMWIKGLAGKAAVAGAESALGPSDVIEGMRQFAPQWAGLGISYDMALASLAHGANYGFRAPELGTAYKSMAMRAIKPTAEGMRWLNRLSIDRSQYMEMDVADPKRGTNQLQALLGNALGKNDKKWLEQELIKGQLAKTTGTPEFRGNIVNQLERRLGKGWAGRRAELESAYDDSIMSPTKFKDGGFDGLMRAIVNSGAGPAALGTIFEGRHIARNDPMFKFYDQMHGLLVKLQATDGSVVDAVVAGRKESEAGKTDQMKASWQDLMIQLEQSGGVIDKVKDAIITLNQALAGLPVEALTGLAAAVAALGAIGVAGMAAAAAPGVLKGAGAAARMTGIPWAVGTTAAAGGAGIGWMLSRLGLLPGQVVGPALGLGVRGPMGMAGLQTAQAARSLGMLGGAKAIALGAGRILIPGLGIISTAAMGYGAYQGYRQTGTVGGALRGALGFGQANAEGGSSGIPNPADAMASLPAAGSGPGEATRQSLADMRAQLSATDLSSEGHRIMETLAAGIRAGSASVLGAMDETVAGIRDRAASAASAGRVNLNTGPAMSGAR